MAISRLGTEVSKCQTFFLRVTIRNTGNLPIVQDDFIDFVTFSLLEGSEFVCKPTLVSSRPGDLVTQWCYDEATVASRASTVQAVIALMNPNDEFTAEFTCTGVAQPPQVKARIVGISDITLVNAEDLRRKKEFLTTLLEIVGFLLGGILINFLFLVFFPSLYHSINTTALLLAIVIAFVVADVLRKYGNSKYNTSR